MKKEFIEEEFNWAKDPVLGASLVMCGYFGITDSDAKPISKTKFYRVGKHKQLGMIAIIPTERDLKHEFINDILRQQNRFN